MNPALLTAIVLAALNTGIATGYWIRHKEHHE